MKPNRKCRFYNKEELLLFIKYLVQGCKDFKVEHDEFYNEFTEEEIDCWTVYI